MKIIPNIYVKVRKLWNTMFGKDGDGDDIKLIKANPTAGESDPDLTGLEIDGNKYKIPEATEVVANPTLAGTEEDLTGLQVGSTKYKVPSGGGGDVYAHYIQLTGGTFTTEGYCVVYDNNSEQYTTVAGLFAEHANTFEYIPIVFKSNNQLCAGTFCNIINATTLSFGTYNLITNEELSAQFSSIASDTVIKLS